MTYRRTSAGWDAARSHLLPETIETDRLPDRHYFKRIVGGLRTHHLSLAQPGSQCHLNQTVFRDALRADLELAEEYARLKQTLAAAHPADRLAYMNGKTEFVLRVLGARGALLDDPDYPRQGAIDFRGNQGVSSR